MNSTVVKQANIKTLSMSCVESAAHDAPEDDCEQKESDWEHDSGDEIQFAFD